MIKYFCDICGKEVQKENCLDTIKINTDNLHSYHNVYYSACESCRINLNEYILKMQEESKKDPYKNAEKKPKPKFKVGDTVKYKTGSINYFVINVKKLNTRYCYDLERRFPNCSKRNYKITDILESRLEEGK